MKVIYLIYQNNQAIKKNNLNQFIINSRKNSVLLNIYYCKYFFQSCLYNSDHITKWLIENNKNNKRLISEKNIINLIKRNNITSLKLIQEKQIYSFENKKLFNISCCYSLEISKWLLSLNLFQLNLEKEKGLFNACMHQKISIIQWLIELRCNFKYNNHSIFIICCYYKKLQTINYLKDIYKNYDYQIIKINNILTTYIKIKAIIISDLYELFEQKSWLKIIKMYQLKNVNFHNDQQCSISYKTANLITPCNHYYDLSNFIRWILINKTCPYCRSNIDLKNCQIDQKFYDQLVISEVLSK